MPMLELDMTFLNDVDCGLLSASQAELGPMAGKITWDNCLNFAAGLPAISDEVAGELRDYFRGYGAWDDEEIDAWTNLETYALAIQEAASQYREAESLCWSDDLMGIDWEAYTAEAERGRISGFLFESDGKLTCLFSR
jgi:hypothetical protein